MEDKRTKQQAALDAERAAATSQLDALRREAAEVSSSLESQRAALAAAAAQLAEARAAAEAASAQAAAKQQEREAAAAALDHLSVDLIGAERTCLGERREFVPHCMLTVTRCGVVDLLTCCEAHTAFINNKAHVLSLHRRQKVSGGAVGGL